MNRDYTVSSLYDAKVRIGLLTRSQRNLKIPMADLNQKEYFN